MWDENNSEIISIGHKELVKLFTLSKFKDENNNITTSLYFYKESFDDFLQVFRPTETLQTLNLK